MKINNVIIFAAGKGSRMNPLTNHVPKPMIKVHGEVMIERNIKFLHECGIKDITIVVGYLKEQFNSLVNKYNVKLIENPMYDESNNISSLLVSKNLWNNTLYIEGDIYLKENIFPSIIQKIEMNNSSVMFGSLNTREMQEWFFIEDENKDVIEHKLGNAKNQKIWTGIYFMNDILSSEMREKVNAWFKINPQKYAEQLFWELKNKFKLETIREESFIELDHFDDLIKIDPSYATQKTYKLFTPGPTNVLETNWDAISSGIVHHRSNLAEHYITKLTESLKRIFNTKEGLPLIVTSSGTGAMEAATISITNKETTSLIINSGDFGKRFADIHKAFGRKYITLEYDHSSSYKKEDIEEIIDKIDVVFVTHHETSIGTLHDVEWIAKYAKSKGKLIVIDAISSLIIEEFKFDEWKVDIALGSSPKSFALPPGISYICVSKDAKEFILENKDAGFYFDLKRYIKYYEEKKQTPFTPAISMILGSIASIESLENIDFTHVRKEKTEMYNYASTELQKIGFKHVIQDEKLRTIAMLTMNAPSNIDVLKMRNQIATTKNIYFEIGREPKTKMIRVGFIGPVSMEDTKLLIHAIKQYVMREQK